jgi:hypothetical protein
MGVLIFSTALSATFLILRRFEQDNINLLVFSCKVPVILFGFNESRLSSQEFLKVLTYEI